MPQRIKFGSMNLSPFTDEIKCIGWKRSRENLSTKGDSFRAGKPRMEMRHTMFVVIHRDTDSMEAADFRHNRG